jgi:hypothetical protein
MRPLARTDLHELVINSDTSPTGSQGLGFTAFRSLLALLDKLKAERTIPYIPHFILAHPRMLEDDPDPGPNSSHGQPHRPTPEYREFATERAVRFFRKVGFRRVGLTPYFAYAVTDISHPSRHILPQADTSALPPQSSLPTPTHHHLRTQPHMPLPLTMSSLDLLVQDSHGQTPLHVATALGLVERCREILDPRECAGEGKEALWIADARGMKPVDLGKRVVQRARERKEAGARGEGRGECERVNECVRLLEGEMRR